MKPIIILASGCCILLSACQNQYDNSSSSLFWYILGGLVTLFVLYRLTRKEPEKEKDAIHAHQYHHFEDFQLSSAEFYNTVKEIITERSFPDVKVSVVSLNAGGMLGHYRDYLEVTRGGMVFYICAAPFGKNFFISYWLKDMPMGCLEVVLFRVLGSNDEKSFYEIDTEAMFVEGIRTAVMKAITAVTEARGLRSLTPAELTPKSI
jgi:hypothetical protein